MAVTGTLNMTGTLSGHPEGTRQVALAWSIIAGLSVSQVGLASGSNTITVPTGATLVILVPPTTNTETITLEGVSGDTGFLISSTRPSVLAWQSGASFVLTTSAAIAGYEVYFI